MQILDTEDDELIDDEPEDDDEDLSAPPRRERAEIPMFKKGHRQLPATPVTTVGQPSPWERPREGFTAAMAQRAPQASATKEGRSVRAMTIATEKF